jgi:hypothetical protein
MLFNTTTKQHVPRGLARYNNGERDDANTKTRNSVVSTLRRFAHLVACATPNTISRSAGLQGEPTYNAK